MTCQDGNLAYENRFHITFGSTELSGLERKAVDVTVPSVTIGTTPQPTQVKEIWIPGDSLDLGDLNWTFLLDDDWANYRTVVDWIQRLRSFTDVDLERDVVDISITLLTAKFKPAMTVSCRDCFPYSVSDVFLNQQVSTTDPVRFLATFKVNGLEYE